MNCMQLYAFAAYQKPSGTVPTQLSPYCSSPFCSCCTVSFCASALSTAECDPLVDQSGVSRQRQCCNTRKENKNHAKLFQNTCGWLIRIISLDCFLQVWLECCVGSIDASWHPFLECIASSPSRTIEKLDGSCGTPTKNYQEVTHTCAVT